MGYNFLIERKKIHIVSFDEMFSNLSSVVSLAPFTNMDLIKSQNG